MTTPSNHEAVVRAMDLAARIVNSDPVLSVYTACEWEELSQDGKVWIASIVAEAIKQAEDDKARAERNRDMWKGQCERQAVDIAGYRDLAKRNNELAKMYKAQADEFRAKYAAATGDPSWA